MKKFLKCIALTLSMMVVCPVFQGAAFAKTVKYKVGDEVQIGKYKGTLISTSQLPKNITPKKVKSTAEAEKILKDQDKVFGYATKQADFKSPVNSLMLSSNGYPSKTRDKVNGNANVGTPFHVVVRYTYSGNRFVTCDSITSYLSGLTAFTDWSQNDSSYSFTDSYRTLCTTVYGVLTSYIVTPLGLVKFHSSNRSVYTEFGV